MPPITFNLNKWLALSPGLTDLDSWKRWAEQDMAWPEAPPPVPTGLIPAMIRRRASSLSKLALQSAIMLAQDQAIDCIIFASRHGELTRVTQLLENILQGKEASPTLFSQTVHNTASGLFTIATKRSVPATSLAAGQDTLHCALLEAAAYLSEYPRHQILVVDFDEPLPDPYCDFDDGDYRGYALAMLLTGGTDCQIHPENTPAPARLSCPQSLAVIRHLARCDKTWSIGTDRRTWHWRRTPKQ